MCLPRMGRRKWTLGVLGERREKTGVPETGGGTESLPSSGALSHRKDAGESAPPGDRVWEATRCSETM